ncbi:sugar O-acyltransferase (sialic acid O-acetyltransferase NeuD family) [Pedobacter sp. CAN_A7]|uniref:acetyltransferase n=1 Tax=Pedobacter sp. CAN_A7 TaxID=2787722 RepID=UPI0018CB70BB
MKKIAIIGSGDLGQQIVNHMVQDNQYDVVGFFDDFKNASEKVNAISVLGGVEDIQHVFDTGGFDELIIGVGYKHLTFRKELFDRFVGKIPFGRFIHSTCIIDNSSNIGEGVVVYPGCIIDYKVNIEPNVLINVGCCIAHDTTIGKHSFLSPRVAIAGFVTIGNECVIGINATVIDNISITSNTQIGGGGVVIKNILNRGLYVGNPVKFIR